MLAAERGERSEEYPYFPAQIREPYLSRRRKVGFELYELYGVERTDLEARKRAMLRNFDFFGAPTGLFFSMERDWGLGAWLDCGMLMMNVMSLAPAFGLETCPQQAWCEYGAAVRRALPLPADQVIVSGMALGYPDLAAKENRLLTQRAGVADFVTVHD
jgi:nitroreductase